MSSSLIGRGASAHGDRRNRPARRLGRDLAGRTLSSFADLGILAEVQVVVGTLAVEREHHHAAAHLRVVGELLEGADRAETGRRILQVEHQANARPAADAIVDGDVLRRPCAVGRSDSR